MNSSIPNKELYNTQLAISEESSDTDSDIYRDVGEVEEYVEVADVNEEAIKEALQSDDFPLGKACDRFDPTCESCQ